jgi:hypothetical protein
MLLYQILSLPSASFLIASMFALCSRCTRTHRDQIIRRVQPTRNGHLVYGGHVCTLEQTNRHRPAPQEHVHDLGLLGHARVQQRAPGQLAARACAHTTRAAHTSTMNPLRMRVWECKAAISSKGKGAHLPSESTALMSAPRSNRNVAVPKRDNQGQGCTVPCFSMVV